MLRPLRNRCTYGSLTKMPIAPPNMDVGYSDLKSEGWVCVHDLTMARGPRHRHSVLLRPCFGAALYHEKQSTYLEALWTEARTKVQWFVCASVIQSIVRAMHKSKWLPTLALSMTCCSRHGFWKTLKMALALCPWASRPLDHPSCLLNANWGPWGSGSGIRSGSSASSEFSNYWFTRQLKHTKFLSGRALSRRTGRQRTSQPYRTGSSKIPAHVVHAKRAKGP